MNKTNKILLLILAILVALFITLLIALSIHNFKPFYIDEKVTNFAYDIRGNKFGPTYWFCRILTELGFFYVLICIVIIVGIKTKFGLPCFILGLGLISNYLLNTIIKLSCNRVRPQEALRWMKETSSSFPSGHSASSMCCYLLLIFFAIKYIQKSKKRNIFIALLTLVILIVGISRIILGVHFITDVIGGYLIGASSATIFIMLFMFLDHKNFKIFQKKDKNC